LPQAPQKPCAFARCPALIRPPARFCAKHVREAEKLDRDRRGSSAERGYGGHWREFRRAFLAKYPLCGMRPAAAERRIEAGGVEWSECKRAGRVHAAVIVDHIAPHRGDAALFWDAANHQALCAHCGNTKSARGM
jgi:5-methylcytosine-specific restriction protein A